MAVIYSIGHSTRPIDGFIALLKAHGVTRLADIRSMPRSRRHPHFSIDSLSVSLPAAGIAYRHFPGLGGLRKPRRDSRNTAWRHAGFRGYADYMETPAFEASLTSLTEYASDGRRRDDVRGGRLVAMPSPAGRRRPGRARRRGPAHHVGDGGAAA